MTRSTTARPKGLILPAPIRAELRRIILEKPGADNGQVRAILRARTGHTVTRKAVAYHRKARKPAEPRYLTEDQRRVLRLLFTAGRNSSREEVRRAFMAQTGRAISAGAVSRFALDVMGLPARATGRPLPRATGKLSC